MDDQRDQARRRAPSATVRARLRRSDCSISIGTSARPAPRTPRSHQVVPRTPTRWTTGPGRRPSQIPASASRSSGSIWEMSSPWSWRISKGVEGDDTIHEHPDDPRHVRLPRRQVLVPPAAGRVRRPRRLPSTMYIHDHHRRRSRSFLAIFSWFTSARNRALLDQVAGEPRPPTSLIQALPDQPSARSTRRVASPCRAGPCRMPRVGCRPPRSTEQPARRGAAPGAEGNSVSRPGHRIPAVAADDPLRRPARRFARTSGRTASFRDHGVERGVAQRVPTGSGTGATSSTRPVRTAHPSRSCRSAARRAAVARNAQRQPS